MKCWKCGQELTDGMSTCLYCGVAQSRLAPTTAAGRAMRALYDRYGAQTILTNSAYLTSGLGDLLKDSKKLRNQLKMAMDAGLGRVYLEQLNAGAPDDNFNRRVQFILTDEAGLNDKAAAELTGYFDEMIGWRMVSQPRAQTYAQPKDTGKVSGSDEIDRGGRNATPGPEIDRSTGNVQSDTTMVLRRAPRIVHSQLGDIKLSEKIFLDMHKRTRMINVLIYQCRIRPAKMLYTMSELKRKIGIVKSMTAMANAWHSGVVFNYNSATVGTRTRSFIFTYYGGILQAEQAGVVRLPHLDSQAQPVPLEIRFSRNADVFAEQLMREGFEKKWELPHLPSALEIGAAIFFGEAVEKIPLE